MQSKIGKIRLILADQKRSAQSMARQVMCAQVQPHQEQEMKRDLLGKLLRLQGILKGAIEDGDQLPRFYDPCLGGPQLDLDGTDQSFMVSLISHIQALQAMQPPSVGCCDHNGIKTAPQLSLVGNRSPCRLPAFEGKA